MLKKIDFANPRHQFFMVLVTNLVYFSILYFYPISNYNLHPPEGAYSENAFFGSDVNSYIRPARNFLQFGVFGRGNTPDYFRTVGYPAYLSALIYLFGKYFFWVAYLIQAVLSALIFSIVTAIIQFFVKNDLRISKAVFICLWLSGAYWIYFPMLLNDLFFTFFFVAGIYYGIKAINEKNWGYCILHLLLLGYAASVRPTLIWYVIPEFFMLLYLAIRFKTIGDQKIKVMIGVASLSIFFLANLSSLRNYINYGVMKPSNALPLCLYDYQAKEILTLANREDDYIKVSTIASNKEKVDWEDAYSFRSKAAFETMRKYPKETAIVLITHFFKNMASSHYFRASTFFLSKEEIHASMGGLNKIKAMNAINQVGSGLKILKQIGFYTVFIFLFFVIIYLFTGILVLKHLFRMAKDKKYLYLLVILSLLAYLIIPTLPVANGPRIRLPIDWLVILLAIIEFYYSLDIYASRFVTASPLK